MKKLLIGCGVIVVLILGFVGYVSWQLWPAVEEVLSAGSAFEEVTQELERRYPYDPSAETAFEPDRFATALELRGAIRGELRALQERMESLEEGDAGIIASSRAALSGLSECLETVGRLLEDARMSPREFVHHVATYWAAAKSAHDGLGDQQALAHVRQDYAEFSDTWGRMRQENPEMPRLSTLLDEVSAAQTEGAREYLEQHRELGDLGEIELVLEVRMIQFADPEQQSKVFGMPGAPGTRVRMERHGEGEGGLRVDVRETEPADQR